MHVEIGRERRPMRHPEGSGDPFMSAKDPDLFGVALARRNALKPGGSKQFTAVVLWQIQPDELTPRADPTSWFLTPVQGSLKASATGKPRHR